MYNFYNFLLFFIFIIINYFYIFHIIPIYIRKIITRGIHSRYHLDAHMVNLCFYVIACKQLGEITRTKQVQCDEINQKNKKLSLYKMI